MNWLFQRKEEFLSFEVIQIVLDEYEWGVQFWTQMLWIFKESDYFLFSILFQDIGYRFQSQLLNI